MTTRVLPTLGDSGVMTDETADGRAMGEMAVALVCLHGLTVGDCDCD
jgi:hypothetical protein